MTRPSQGKLEVQFIDIQSVFTIPYDSEDIYFAFESQYTPFQKYVVGILPRTDLVIQQQSNGKCLTALEVKLTALPDNTTCNDPESDYGCEIVVRPDTVVYLACSIAFCLGESLNNFIHDINIANWSDPLQVLSKIKIIVNTIKQISLELEIKQEPFLLQPIWKTQGKSPKLSEHCLDVFVWSNAGFCNFISNIANDNPQATKITRQTRTVIWLFKMLLEIKNNSKFNHRDIIDSLSYNTKNDKAFASSGKITNKYMKCDRLSKPIITKKEIQNIILGGGQDLLSPERRFDVIIFNSPELFD